MQSHMAASQKANGYKKTMKNINFAIEDPLTAVRIAKNTIIQECISSYGLFSITYDVYDAFSCKLCALVTKSLSQDLLLPSKAKHSLSVHEGGLVKYSLGMAGLALIASMLSFHLSVFISFYKYI